MTVYSYSDEQVDKARHALGLTRQKVAYRNYYSSSVDDSDWNDLVERGLATKRKSPASPDFLYHLTLPASYHFLNEGESIGSDISFPPEASSR